MDELIPCIEKCEGKTMKPKDIKEVFMYVKNCCTYSKAAAAESAKYETCVLDLRTKSFVASEDITQKKLKQDDPTGLLNAYDLLKEYSSWGKAKLFEGCLLMHTLWRECSASR